MSSQEIESIATHASNVVWHHATVTRARREAMNGHKGGIIWFTGLSGAGKSTLAHAVEEALHQKGCRTFVLDGDNVRHGLCSDLGFSDADREENIRRNGQAFHAGWSDRANGFHFTVQSRSCACQKHGGSLGEFVAVYCDAPLGFYENRDVKGLYKKARERGMAKYTGVSSPYEAPTNPELILNTAQDFLEIARRYVIDAIERYNLACVSQADC